MTRAARLAALIAIAPLVAAEPAHPPAELQRLFPHESDVRVEREGISRLVLPGEVLAPCRPDLSDLRLFDQADREVAFLIDGRERDPGAIEIAQRFEAPLLDVARSEERRESAPPLRREVLEIGVPGDPPRTGSWDLVVTIEQPEFVAKVEVLALSGQAEPKVLVASGSLFRLGGARRAARLRLPLPPFSASRLRITLETEQPFWLEPALQLESASRVLGGWRIDMPLDIVARHDEPGRTVVELARPRGLIPDALRVRTKTSVFDRPVEVRDEGPGRAADPLGRGRVFRVAAYATVEELDVALDEASGDRLRVTIEDGDSPPLAELAFAALVRQPALIFSVDRVGAEGLAGTLRFGGARAHLPRYDLAALIPPLGGSATGSRARAASLLYDPTAIGAARLGPIRANPSYDGAPALAFAMRPGADVERGRFRYLRRLRVPEAPEGLARLRLEPADLAVLRADLADLRVADAEARQWPYLLEPDAGSALVRLETSGSRGRDRRSSYELRPPLAPLALDRIVLEIEAPYFDRAFEARATPEEGDETVVASGRLVRHAGDAGQLGIDLRPVRARALRLIVEDGDDAPLVLREVQGRVRLPDLYVTAPAGTYSLLLGAPAAAPPSYELARVRDVVLAVRAAEVETGPLGKNPQLGLRARLGRWGELPGVALWIVLIVAVVVLAGITLRLARR